MSRWVLLLTFLGSVAWAGTGIIHIGSKKFTENIILAEMATHLVRNAGYKATHTKELGGTRLLWNSLLSGEIDIYPEYTGTIVSEILAGENIRPEGIASRLASLGISVSKPIGFNNTYAIGVPKKIAERFGLKRISDLAEHPELRFGFTAEFMDRGDGWPGLRRRYALPQKTVTGLDHDLAYRGIQSGSLDVMDLYSTDAEIGYYDLVVLEDDRHYFPDYQAVLLYRQELNRYPGLVESLLRMQGLLTEERMITLNAESKFEKRSAAVVAANFLKETLGFESDAEAKNRWRDLRRYTKSHLLLVGISLGAAILTAIPLGVLAAKIAFLSRFILLVVGIIQTIPSLALLVFMIPLFGIGTVPAVIALFFYSLLPIVRNTYQGLTTIPIQLRETSQALGLPPAARLFRIELPLASSSILAGVKTAAIINIGTATLGALIGAGGFGQPILTGIRLDSTELILLGAVPAAVMALAAQLLFDLAERFVVPRGLRL